jgi:hypothetical protein
MKFHLYFITMVVTQPNTTLIFFRLSCTIPDIEATLWLCDAPEQLQGVCQRRPVAHMGDTPWV